MAFLLAAIHYIYPKYLQDLQHTQPKSIQRTKKSKASGRPMAA